MRVMLEVYFLQVQVEKPETDLKLSSPAWENIPGQDVLIRSALKRPYLRELHGKAVLLVYLKGVRVLRR